MVDWCSLLMRNIWRPSRVVVVSTVCRVIASEPLPLFNIQLQTTRREHRDRVFGHLNSNKVHPGIINHILKVPYISYRLLVSFLFSFAQHLVQVGHALPHFLGILLQVTKSLHAPTHPLPTSNISHFPYHKLPHESVTLLPPLPSSHLFVSSTNLSLLAHKPLRVFDVDIRNWAVSGFSRGGFHSVYGVLLRSWAEFS